MYYYYYFCAASRGPATAFENGAERSRRDYLNETKHQTVPNYVAGDRRYVVHSLGNALTSPFILVEGMPPSSQACFKRVHRDIEYRFRAL